MCTPPIFHPLFSRFRHFLFALFAALAAQGALAAPSITSASPSTGLNTAGGDAITATGSGFVQTTLAFTQVSSSSNGYHTCGMGTDGLAYCWGRNNYGQLGNNSITDSPVPVAVDTSGALAGKTIKQISAGDGHTCAIASDNQAYCWGSNGDGRLGNNSTASSRVPVAVTTSGALNGLNLKQISAGGYHTCVIASDNQAYCWGWNGYGQLGNNSTTGSLVPVAVTTSGALTGLALQQISAGTSHTCAIASDNKAYCWGYNNYGQLGNNSATNSPVPVAVTIIGTPLAGLTLKQISAGISHTCAIASDQAYCWGYNVSGQLGNNSTTDSPVAVAVDTSGVLAGKTIKQIAVGEFHTCAIASDDQAYCWGWNGSGPLGNNSITSSPVPVAVTTAGTPLAGLTLKQISAGYAHTCAIASGDKAYCWGWNAYGQLGNNSTTNSPVPVAVGALITPTVTVGGVAATNVVVVSDTQITFTAPAKAAGTYGLTLDYGGGVTATLANALTYVNVIASAAITVTAPVTGATPATAVTACATNTTCGAVAWSPSAATFAGGTQYTATVTLTANTGYTFTGLTGATLNGQTATVTNNTGGAVTLSYQFPATAAVIANPAITVTAPVTGATPNTAVTACATNTTCGAVTWSPSATTFAGGTQYTASVTLTAASGYTFTELTSATLNGQTATVTNNTGGAVTLAYQFPATATVIASAAVTVTAPAVGAAPGGATPDTGSHFSVDAVAWSPNDPAFLGDTPYTVTVTLKADSGYTFTGLPTTAARIDSQAATVTNNTGDQVMLTYVFAALVASADVTITAPAAGAAPDTAASSTGHFSVSAVTWTPADSPFKAGQTYTATVTLTAASGYTFDPNFTASLNGKTATVKSNDGATVVLEIKFQLASASATAVPTLSEWALALMALLLALFSLPRWGRAGVGAWRRCSQGGIDPAI